MVRFDYHTHSNYSDGYFIPGMVRAAEAAGLDGIGFADHCNVTADGEARRRLDGLGFALDETYPRRREGIEWVRTETDLAVYDAVEMDYVPGREADIASFLDEAAFDYAVGSVHSVEGDDVQWSENFVHLDDDERRAVVDGYYDNLAALAESELFEIAAHADLVERTPELRGYSTAEQYEQVADAFADADTVPEINAGRVLDDYGEFHPAPDLLDTLLDRGVEFVVGSDSHRPEEVGRRIDALERRFDELAIEPTTLSV
ncbi:histidinol-phosphatase [Halolamina sp. CBA1230]|uniref:PHP domain-containing protein n=1 Tax=Halolamina sp. CBA1230 TaxID=1853690 RepID=UPI0009A19C69|nr:PHP domain-containing protein [Halolamina sp. CBA1230]QKY20267.1 histidinol-phosphatase [Halolamina sp. CBA1230]